MVNNVKVFCRFRPQNASELAHNGQPCHRVLDEQSVQLAPQPAAAAAGVIAPATPGGSSFASSGPFSFDRVFDVDSTQREVYESVGRDLVAQCLDGYHCTCFAYGQTGAGKTYSMMGSRTDEAQAGIIPRVVADIFSHINAASGDDEFTVKASYVEIYLERIRDLLRPAAASNGGCCSRSNNNRNATPGRRRQQPTTGDPGDINSQNLRIRHDKKGRGLYIEGVTEQYLSNPEEMIRLVLRGDAARATASTNMNAASSRSHSIFIITVAQKNATSGVAKTGKLFICDLAGSEMVKKTAATGDTLREAKQINKSLSALGNVIKALTEGAAHVPYRDSALTRLLSEALGGNSKTSLLVAASSSSYNLMETQSTLRFGVRAKRIKNRATQNKQLSMAQCRALVHSSKRQLAESRAHVEGWRVYAVSLEQVLQAHGLAVPAGRPAVTIAARRRSSDQTSPVRTARAPASTAAAAAAAAAAAPAPAVREATPTQACERGSLTKPQHRPVVVMADRTNNASTLAPARALTASPVAANPPPATVAVATPAPATTAAAATAGTPSPSVVGVDADEASSTSGLNPDSVARGTPHSAADDNGSPADSAQPPAVDNGCSDDSDFVGSNPAPAAVAAAAGFSDDESAGSVDGFSNDVDDDDDNDDDDDDDFGGYDFDRVDDEGNEEEDFEALLHFDDSASDGSGGGSFFGDDNTSDDGRGEARVSAAATAGGTQQSAAAVVAGAAAAEKAAAAQTAAAGGAGAETELAQLQLQQELTAMTERFLRTKVAMLEQKQQLERTRTLVADRAACENQDLKAALNGRNEHIANLQVEMMRLAQQNVRLQETVMQHAARQREKEDELRQMEENLHRYINVGQQQQQTPLRKSTPAAIRAADEKRVGGSRFVSPIIVKPVRGGGVSRSSQQRPGRAGAALDGSGKPKPFSLKDIFANIGKKRS